MDATTQIAILLLFGVSGVVMIAASNGWTRRMREVGLRAYADPRNPYLLRTMWPMGNALGLLSLGFGALAFLPPSAGRWAVVPLLLAVPAVLFLCYRSPERLMSPWFRDAVRSGGVAAPTPDPGVRLLLAILSLPMLLGGITALLLDLSV